MIYKTYLQPQINDSQQYKQEKNHTTSDAHTERERSTVTRLIRDQFTAWFFTGPLSIIHALSEERTDSLELRQAVVLNRAPEEGRSIGCNDSPVVDCSWCLAVDRCQTRLYYEYAR